MYHLPKFIAELPSREGVYAIYIEPSVIAYVRVSDVRGDNQGVSATIDVVPTLGMNDACDPSFRICSTWETFSNSHDHWHAIYVNWSVYFGAGQVRLGLKLAAEAAANGARVQLRQIREALENADSG